MCDMLCVKRGDKVEVLNTLLLQSWIQCWNGSAKLKTYQDSISLQEDLLSLQKILREYVGGEGKSYCTATTLS